MDHGRIVQAGTHQTLLANKGAYQRLASLQVVDEDSLRLLDIPPTGQEAT